MSVKATAPHNSVVPLLRYRDLARAMEWLADVFGFEKQIAISDQDGEVVYGQMKYGESLIMLGTVRDTDLDGFMTQPDEVGGFETQTCYVVIDNADEHFSRSVMAGADILLELKSDAHGRRGYACRDPEGHIWNFGTFHPTMTSLTRVSETAEPLSVETRATWPRRLAMAASLMLALGAGYLSRDFVAADRMVTVAAEEGTADYAYQLLAVVRGEARQLQADRDRIKGQLETVAADKAKLEIELRTLNQSADREKTERASLESELRETREHLKSQDLERDAALKRAREAEARVEELSREKVATAGSVGHLEAERDAQELKASVLQEGSLAIETSATTPSQAAQPATPAVPVPGSKDESGNASHPEKSVVARRNGSAKKYVSMGAAKSPYRPTYVIELSEVPWPYAAWHAKKIKP